MYRNCSDDHLKNVQEADCSTSKLPGIKSINSEEENSNGGKNQEVSRVLVPHF